MKAEKINILLKIFLIYLRRLVILPRLKKKEGHISIINYSSGGGYLILTNEQMMPPIELKIKQSLSLFSPIFRGG